MPKHGEGVGIASLLLQISECTHIISRNNLILWCTGGRSDRRHTGRRAQGQVANGVLDGRQMLHDVRQRRVLGKGTAHGVRRP